MCLLILVRLEGNAWLINVPAYNMLLIEQLLQHICANPSRIIIHSLRVKPMINDGLDVLLGPDAKLRKTGFQAYAFELFR